MIIIIIVILIVIILNLMKLILMKSENFDDNVFDELGNVMSQLDSRQQNKIFLDSIDKSILEGGNKFSGMSANKLDQSLLDEYINNLINSDFKNTNKILESKPNNKLPTVDDTNLPKLFNYNHEMRIINNSRKLKQEYIIKILKYKVMKLLNTTKRVHELDQ